MSVIAQSAEYHFYTTIEEIRPKASEWTLMHFQWSYKISHTDLLKNINQIQEKLAGFVQSSTLFAQEIESQLNANACKSYVMSNSDVIILLHANNPDDVDPLFQKYAARIGMDNAFCYNVSTRMYAIQQLRERLLLSIKEIHAYQETTDTHKVQSIKARREKRDDIIIMLVEDDRFTASYIINILSRDYDVVHVRSGEDAILAYMDHAPDVIFIDIHLPGIDGYQVLETILKVDPDCYAVVLSADSVRSNVENACRIGADSFLKKPFTKERLLSKVHKAPTVKQALLTRNPNKDSGAIIRY
jgi:CheY-like chemotaxis protein